MVLTDIEQITAQEEKFFVIPHTRNKSITALFKCCALPLLLIYCSQLLACPVENKTIRITAGSHVLTTEVATDLAGHMCGLAFRRELAADHGMLFAYGKDQILGFWMKDTFIPLSIAFLDSNGRILEIHKMAPLDTNLRYISKSPGRYALEVNQGWFFDNGIKVGDRLEFDLQAEPNIFRYSHQ